PVLRAHVDEASAHFIRRLLLQHLADGASRHQELPPQIDTNQPVPVFLGRIYYWNRIEDSGVVHHDIDTSIRVQSRSEKPCHIRRARDIRADELPVATSLAN